MIASSKDPLELQRDITLLLNRRTTGTAKVQRISAKRLAENKSKFNVKEIEWMGYHYLKRNSETSTLSGMTESTIECNSRNSSSSVVLLRSIVSKTSNSLSSDDTKSDTESSDDSPKRPPASIIPFSRREQVVNSMMTVPEHGRPQCRRHSITVLSSPPPPPPPHPQMIDNDDVTAKKVTRRGSLDSSMGHLRRLPIEIELQGQEKETRDTDAYDDILNYSTVVVSIAPGRSQHRRRSMTATSNSSPPQPPQKPFCNEDLKMTRRGSLDSNLCQLKRLPMDLEMHGDETRSLFVSQDTILVPSLYDESELNDDDDYDNDTLATDCRFVRDLYLEDPHGERGAYTGEISRATGRPNGKGRMDYEDSGKWYDGDWVYGLWDGHSQLCNSRGDVYHGRFVKGCKHGRGVTEYADGRQFEGIFKKDKMLRGKMSYVDGSSYHGEWRNGQRHGQGKYMFDSEGANWYEGEFQDDLFHGIGRMQWADGGFYFGQWMNGEMHGDGQEVLADGTLRHDGTFRQGRPVRICPKVRRSSIL